MHGSGMTGSLIRQSSKSFFMKLLTYSPVEFVLSMMKFKSIIKRQNAKCKLLYLLFPETVSKVI